MGGWARVGPFPVGRKHSTDERIAQIVNPICVLREGRRDGYVSIALSARKVSVSDGIHISSAVNHNGIY